MGAPAVDCVLLVGFGGPTPGCCKAQDPCPGEAHCFVEGVLGRETGRAERVEEVAAHYRHLGGFSRYNGHTYAQAEALAAALAERGLSLPVRAGFRHWRPFVREAMAGLAGEGYRKVLAVILAPHQSSISWDWYVKVTAESLDPLGAAAPRVSFLDPWWTHEGFIEANAERVRETAAGWGRERTGRAELVFTAHGIPEAVARTGPYVRQFHESAGAVARRLGERPFSIAFQSGPRRPAIPWTGPDIRDVMEERAAPGLDFIVAPIGFLSDNVEVLYDLDVEACRIAGSRGSGFVRAGTVGSHPAFIGMLADLIIARCRAR